MFQALLIASILESDVQACACAGMAQDVRTSAGTYVDCLSDTYAIEVEATQDWAEAIGQSLHYAEETGRAAKVLFFCEVSESACYRHMLRFESTVSAYSLPIEWGYVQEECY